VYSVACLEWGQWIWELRRAALADATRRSPDETVSAKEAKDSGSLPRKTSRLLERVRLGITVCSKWLSGGAKGNPAIRGIIGNFFSATKSFREGEIRPDL